VTVAMQWFGNHVSTIEAVFSAGSVQRSYLKRRTVSDSGNDSEVQDSGK
jgi:hypothetical protein